MFIERPIMDVLSSASTVAAVVWVGVSILMLLVILHSLLTANKPIYKLPWFIAKSVIILDKPKTYLEARKAINENEISLFKKQKKEA